MKHQIATTPEQSQRLIACGVNPDTADMVWTKWSNDGEELLSLSVLDESAYEVACLNPVEAWSLSALLELLPKEITDDNGDSYYLSIAQEFPLSYEYGVSYKPCWSDGDAIIRKRDNCPIEACVKAIEWLTANGYKLNEI